MLRRDYIMKLIQQLFDSLFLLLNEGSDDEVKKEKLNKFYEEYLGSTKKDYLDSSLEDIVVTLKEKYGQEELLYRVEMLSEILYSEALLTKSAERYSLLNKALELFIYLDEHSNTYSLVREEKKDAVRKELEGI